jgi:hypothetical protein
MSHPLQANSSGQNQVAIIEFLRVQCKPLHGSRPGLDGTLSTERFAHCCGQNLFARSACMNHLSTRHSVGLLNDLPGRNIFSLQPAESALQSNIMLLIQGVVLPLNDIVIQIKSP